MTIVTVNPDKDLEDGQEARGFWCIDEGVFVNEDEVESDSSDVDTETAECPSCGTVGTLTPVSVVQRTE